jgi:hypothetical protein
VGANEVVNQYDSVIRVVLSSYPTALAEFEQCIGRQDYRSAYVLVHKTMRERSLSLTPEQDRIAERFFWDYIY